MTSHSMTTRPGKRTVGFVDLAGFTALTEAHGDEQAVALLERFEQPVAVAAREAGLEVVDLGSFDPRNLSAPVELFQIAVDPELSGAATDPVCRMRVLRSTAAGRLRHDDHDHWFCSLDCAAAFASEPHRYREA